MYIKQIVIQGFKSYKEQTEVETFSSGLNVIVGRNGSGKSNFFAAIRFVLSDDYTQMGAEQRQALLHEGSGSAVMTAFVEIIIDNSDERFPTGKPELIIRRTVNAKKDEYSLDRKNAQRSDVMNLLESAGFSRSNPYYIVPQGRVTALTNMKDSERLQVLKIVAGTQVYEARRAESLKSMHNADNLQEKVKLLLHDVDDRLNQLEEEKEELRKYQERDRESRCLQYTILNREQQEYNNAIDKFNSQRSHGVEETDETRQQVDDIDQAVSQLDQDMADAKQSLDLHLLEKRQLEDERKEAQRAKAGVEMSLQSLFAGQDAAQQAQAQRDQDLQQLQGLVDSRTEELAHLIPQFTRVKTQEHEAQAKLGDAEALQNQLFTKQGYVVNFKSKKDRDTYLKTTIDDYWKLLNSLKTINRQIDDEVAETQERISGLQVKTEEIKQGLESRPAVLHSIATQIEQAKERRDQLVDKRKERWRTESRLNSSISSAKQELEKTESVLQRLTDRDTWQGIKSVRRLQQDEHLTGIYGVLGELLTVDQIFQTAVEVTAGASLFNVVVEDDEIATKIVSALYKSKGGRVTMMPLNRISARNANLPNSAEAIAMISRISYDKHFENAFQQVFGKTVICPNLQVASQFARSHGVSAITTEGDRAEERGALSGGFHDIRQSRINAIRNEARCREELQSKQAEYDQLKMDLDRLDQQITKAVSDISKLESQRTQTDNSYGPLREELRTVQRDLHQSNDFLQSKEDQRIKSATQERSLLRDIKSAEDEIKSEFKKVLSSHEEELLASLPTQIRDFRKAYQEFSQNRSTLQAKKYGIEQELTLNLQPRLDQLLIQEPESQSLGRGGPVDIQVKDQQRELKRTTKILNDLETKHAEAEAQVEQASHRFGSMDKEKTEKMQRREDLIRTIERFKSRMESSMRRKAEATKLLAECNKKIRDLGVLPEEAFRKYEKWDSKRAMERLQKVNKDLKQYKNVNKKAYEQYNNFTKQRTDLKKRRNELDTSKASIQNLIDHLDHRKDEAIERTFKQVSKEFASVFEKLVPAGKGRLIIQRKTDRQIRQEDEDSEEEARQSVENYTGVGISVSFNSKHDEQQRIQQLSGGQKSLCALALVFAIQQCDPAPFYLFDEIDANLDAQYRTAVAQMLQTLSEARNSTDAAGNNNNNNNGAGQFICTTFRPEMLLVAAKCYGVSFSNKTSSVDVVSKEQAMDFVENTQAAR